MSTHLASALAGLVLGVGLYWLLERWLDRVAETFTVTGHAPEVVNPPCAPDGAHDIWAARLVTLLIASGVVFPEGCRIWIGTAEELARDLVAPNSKLNVNERREVPTFSSLTLRLGAMSRTPGRVTVQFHSYHPSGARNWQLTLNGGR